jgi:hypothetical protein
VDVTKIGDLLRLAPRLLFALALASGFLLFASNGLAATLGVEGFRTEASPWLGIGFVVSSAAWLSHGLARVARFFGQRITRWRTMKVMRSTLKHLSPAERELLREFIDADTRTVTLDMSKGTHAALEARNVIYRASTVSRFHTFFDYNIQPWAWEYLKKRPEVLRDS